MDLFWKTTASVLIGLILVLTLGKQEKDLAVLLTAVLCCLAGAAAVKLLSPVLEFLKDLQSLADLDNTVLRLLMQMLGVGLVTELTVLLCADAGCSSLGNTAKLLGSAMILRVSLPVFESLTELIQGILGNL